jgi:peptide/nickel transport system substrate-binding protein
MRPQLFRPFRVPLSPGDYLIGAGIGVVLIVGTFWLAATVSMRFTHEIPAHGGSYTEALIGTPRFINPVLALSDVDRDMVQLVFSGLMRSTNDGVIPDLAESYSLSEDKKTYTFILRQDARFHDSTPVTAADVAFTVSLAQNPVLKSPKRANWEGVVTEIVDDRTITFTLKEPYAPFIENARLGILPMHLWQEVSVEEISFSKLNSEPVGSGPYAFSKLATNSGGIPSSLTLTAATDGTRVPYISELSFSFLGDSDALLTAIQKDSALAAHSILIADTADSRTVHEAILGRVFGVFFNQNQNSLFADKTVRQALDNALDKKSIVSTLIGGFGSPLSGPLPPQSLDDVPELVEHSLATSTALLTRAGWTKGDDGIWIKKDKKSTTRLAFTLRTGNAPELKGAAELVRDAWRAFGADVTLELFDAGDLQQDVIRPRKYDALLFGEVVGREADLFAFWDSSQRNDPGLNVALYTNSTVDALVRTARATDDATERSEATQKAARIISDETAAVFLYSPHFIFSTPPTIRGITLTTIVTPADRFLTIDTWYQKTERVWPLFK